MNLRLALYAVADRYGLDPTATVRLMRLAGLGAEPDDLGRWVVRGVGALAAVLLGLGLVMWVAANWEVLGRFGQLVLLQGFVLAACIGALMLPRARPALALLALLGIGGLLAHIGQTYQTGADPWQLFAWWALLGLGLGLAVRSDLLWVPWALVALTAVALWDESHAGGPWASGPDVLAARSLAWIAACLVVVWLSPTLSRLTGAGTWSLRIATTLAVALVTMTALLGLFHGRVPPDYWLGLAVLSAAASGMALSRVFDLGTLGAVVLGLDTLVVAGLAHWMLSDATGRHGLAGSLLLSGLLAALLVAASVMGLLRLARLRAVERP